jgi:uncharacterized protein (TIGR03546 family)
MLGMLANLFKALNSESSPMQVSIAVALGFIVGMTPIASPHNLILLFVVCVTRLNFTAFLLSISVFSLFSYLFDPIMNNIGSWVLTHPSLNEYWTSLYQSNVWRVTRFNNTLVMGSFILSIVLSVPVIFLSRWLINTYRERVMKVILKWKIVQIFQASKFYKLYQLIAD